MMLPVLVFIWGLQGGAGCALGTTGTTGAWFVELVVGVAPFNTDDEAGAELLDEALAWERANSSGPGQGMVAPVLGLTTSLHWGFASSLASIFATLQADKTSMAASNAPTCLGMCNVLN